MAKKKAQADADEPGFEASLECLESIVRRLEQGGGALEEALGDYSAAIELLKNCHQRLEAAERKVEMLSGIDAQGNPITRPMDSAAATLAEKQENRSDRRSTYAGGDTDTDTDAPIGRSQKSSEDALGLF